MKVIDFVNWLSAEVESSYVVKTHCSNDFTFVVNESINATSSSDTCIDFDGGISAKGLINYVARHNLEGYAMYNSGHGDVYFDDIHVHVADKRVYVQ